ncbi:MAG: L,D-transpeptidase family protein [Ectothiorhodospiraceae bacterium]|nr:L,D-transpeptidase family protein [Ectothiorhodospiraceae bacterium]
MWINRFLRPRGHQNLLLVFILLSPLWIPGTAVAEGDDPLREALRYRVESIPPDQPLVAGTDTIMGSQAVRRFYQERLYRPAWVDENGDAPMANQLLRALEHARREGMNPEDYQKEWVQDALARLRDLQEQDAVEPRHLVDIELLLSSTWITLGSHSLLGRLDPENVDPQWRINRRGGDLHALLNAAIEEGAVYQGLRELLPQDAGYARLRDALAHYRGIVDDGGLVDVPAGPTMRLGDQGERVALLRQRLIQTADLDAAEFEAPERFDRELDAAVRRFQTRHGLEVDGLVGRNTLAVMNISAESRVRQILVNLERWRWMPQDLGERYIMVNIAGFEMTVVEEGETVMSQRVIVGRDYRQTPVFSGRMTYLVLNPSWEVPNSIAVRDLLPQIRRDPDYFDRMGFQLFQGWGASQREIDASTVDWHALSAARFPYRFRQRPGPLNALGTVKFMFPNQYAVYLHDTPSRDLFQRADRAFSSGCIRVERPMDLTEYLLADSARWSPMAIRTALDSRREQTITLPRAMPVYLQYLTAWVDKEGVVHLRNDLYNRDSRVADALQAPPRAVANL